MVVKHPRWTLQFGFWWLIVTILTMSLFYFLGMWQLQRYHDKQNWLETQSEIEIEGTFLDNFILFIDNKIMHQKPGYEVFQAFQLRENTRLTSQVVLISRGWIEQPKNAQQHHVRSHLPQIPLPSQDPIQIKAKIINIIPSKTI